jgi:exoribonuclease-2
VTAAQVVLVQAEEAGLQVGRCLAIRPGQPLRVEVRVQGGVGSRTLRLDRSAVHAQLNARCETLDEAEALAVAARQRLDHADIEAVWTLVEDHPTGLGEVAQLLLGTADPAARDTTALALGLDNDAFFLQLGQLHRRSAAERTALQAQRAQDAAVRVEVEPWLTSLDLRRTGAPVPKERLAPWIGRLQAWIERPDANDPAVERLLTLRGRHRQPHPRDAAELLTEVGAWDGHEDLELLRTGLLAPWPDEVLAAALVHPDLPDGLPHLDLPFATIDNDDPHEVDDAVFAERHGDGVRLWVAIASPASWVPRDGVLDRAAQLRGATLYHPRYVMGMLPDSVARDRASLATGKWKPALVFSIDLDAQGRTRSCELREAMVLAAHAWSYRRVDASLASGVADGDVDLAQLRLLVEICLASEQQRIGAGAYLLYKPDVELRAPPHQGVTVRPASQTSPGRRMITEAMVLCGAAAGRIASQARLPLPYRSQAKPQGAPLPPGLYTTPADVFAVFRTLAPAHTTTSPEPHAMMGIESYAQVTSPLRRYGDLLAQRQLLAHVRGQPLPYSATALSEAVTTAEAGAQERRHWQRRGDRYFKLVWLAAHASGRPLLLQVVRALAGQGQLLGFLPDLALEIAIHAPHAHIGDWLEVVVRHVHPSAGELSVTPVR